MREFFRGWKRKLGFVTLAMACGSAAVWLQCMSFNNLDHFGLISHQRETLHLTRDGITWGAKNPESILWNWWHIPYWSIALPLTALSAWLLLSKPRPAKHAASRITIAN